MRIWAVIIRWLLAAACIATFFFLIKRATQSDFSRAAGFSIIGIGLLFGFVFLIVPETVKPFSEFIGECFGNLIFPNARFKKPPLSYFLAHLYSQEMRYEEAAQEYEKIIHYYPNERTAYLELISIYKLTGQAKLAQRYLRRFRKRFKAMPPRKT